MATNLWELGQGAQSAQTGTGGFNPWAIDVSGTKQDTVTVDWDNLNKTQPVQPSVPTPIATPATPSSIDQSITAAAKKYGLDENLIRAVIGQESRGDALAVSPKGAQGLMQLMPETAADMGVTDSFDTHQNIMGGSRYLKGLLDRYDGDVSRALQGYNAGPDKVRKVETGAIDSVSGKPHVFRQETVDYVPGVMGRWNKLRGEARGAADITTKEAKPYATPVEKAEPALKEEQFTREDTRNVWQMMTDPAVPPHVLDELAEEARNFEDFGGEDREDNAIDQWTDGVMISYDLADIEMQKGKIGFKMREGTATEADARRLQELKDESTLLHERVKEQPYTAQAVGELLPYLQKIAIERGKGALIGATVGGTVGAAAGNLIPGATFLPEEMLTAPGGAWAGMKVGSLFGSTKEMSEIEGGSLFLQLKDAGIDDDIARNVSTLYGGGAAGLENLQFGLLKRLLPGGGKLAKKTITRALVEQLTKNKALRVGAMHAGVSLAEGGVEGVQQLAQNVSELAAQYAMDELRDTNMSPESVGEYIDELKKGVIESFGKAATGTAIIGVPLTGMNAAATAEEVVDRSEAKQTGRAVKDIKTEKVKQTKLEAAIEKANLARGLAEKEKADAEVKEAREQRQTETAQAAHEQFQFNDNQTAEKQNEVDRVAQAKQEAQQKIEELFPVDEEELQQADFSNPWTHFLASQTGLKPAETAAATTTEPAVELSKKEQNKIATQTKRFQKSKAFKNTNIIVDALGSEEEGSMIPPGMMQVTVDDPALYTANIPPTFIVPINGGVRALQQKVKTHKEKMKPATEQAESVKDMYQREALANEGVNTEGMTPAQVEQQYNGLNVSSTPLERLNKARSVAELAEDREDVEDVFRGIKQTDVNTPAIMLMSGDVFQPTNPDGTPIVLEGKHFSKRTEQDKVNLEDAYRTAYKQAIAAGMEPNDSIKGFMLNDEWYSGGSIIYNSNLIGKAKKKEKVRRKKVQKKFDPQTENAVLDAVQEETVAAGKKKFGENLAIDTLFKKMTRAKNMKRIINTFRAKHNRLSRVYRKRFTNKAGLVFPDELDSVAYGLAWNYVQGKVRAKEKFTQQDMRNAVINGLKNFTIKEEAQASGKSTYEINNEIADGTFQSVQVGTGVGREGQVDYDTFSPEASEQGDETLLANPYADREVIMDSGYLAAISILRNAIRKVKKNNPAKAKELKGKGGVRTPDSEIITMAMEHVSPKDLNMALESIDIDMLPSAVTRISPEQHLKEKAVAKAKDKSMQRIWKNPKVRFKTKFDMLRNALGIMDEDVTNAEVENMRADAEVGALATNDEAIAKADMYREKHIVKTQILKANGKPYLVEERALDIAEGLNTTEKPKMTADMKDLYFTVEKYGDGYAVVRNEVFDAAPKPKSEGVDKWLTEDTKAPGEQLLGAQPKEEQPFNKPVSIQVKQEDGSWKEQQITPTAASNEAGSNNAEAAERLYWARYAAVMEWITEQSEADLKKIAEGTPKAKKQIDAFMLDPSMQDFMFRHRTKERVHKAVLNRISGIEVLKRLKLPSNLMVITASAATAATGVTDAKSNKDIDVIVSPKLFSKLDKHKDIERKVEKDGTVKWQTKDGTVEFFMAQNWPGNVISNFDDIVKNSSKAGNYYVENLLDVADRYTGLKRTDKAKAINDAVRGDEAEAITIEDLEEAYANSKGVKSLDRVEGVTRKTKARQTQVVGQKRRHDFTVLETPGEIETEIKGKVQKYLTHSAEKVRTKLAEWYEGIDPSAQRIIDEIMQKENELWNEYNKVRDRQRRGLKINAQQENLLKSYQRRLRDQAIRGEKKRKREAAEKPITKKAPRTLRTPEGRQVALERAMKELPAEEALSKTAKDRLTELAKQAKEERQKHGKVIVEDMADGENMFRFEDGFEIAGKTAEHIYANLIQKRRNAVKAGKFNHYVKRTGKLRRMKQAAADTAHRKFEFKAVTPKTKLEDAAKKKKAEKRKKADKKKKIEREKFAFKKPEDLTKEEIDAMTPEQRASVVLGEEATQEEVKKLAAQAEKVKENLANKAHADVRKSLEIAYDNMPVRVQNISEDGKIATVSLTEGPMKGESIAVDLSKGDPVQALSEEIIERAEEESAIEKASEVRTQKVNKETAKSIEVDGRQFLKNQSFEYYEDLLDKHMDLQIELSEEQEEWVTVQMNEAVDRDAAEYNQAVQDAYNEAEEISKNPANLFKDEGGFFVIDEENSPVARGVRATAEWFGKLFKARRMGYDRFKEMFDVESNFKSQELGFHVKNQYSFREAEMDKFEKDVLKPFAKIVNKVMPKATPKQLASIVFATEDDRYETEIRKQEGGDEIWNKVFKEPVEFLRNYFDKARKDYQERGIDVDFVAHEMARQEQKWLESENFETAVKAAAKLAALQGTNFVHLPSSFWAAKNIDKLIPSDLSNRQFSKAKSNLREELRRRHAITIGSLVRKGLIKEEAVNPFEILLHYSAETSKNMAMYNIRDAALKSGDIRTRKRKPTRGEWVDISGKDMKHLSALRTHKMKKAADGTPLKTYAKLSVVDAFNRALASDAPTGIIERSQSMYKMLRFYNMFFLPMYDVIQSIGLAGAVGIHTPSALAGAIKSAFTKDEEYYAALRGGLASKPFAPWWGDQLTQARRQAVIQGKGRIMGTMQYYFANEIKEILDLAKDAKIGKATFRTAKAAVMPFMEASWNMAWKMDKGVRLYTYQYLRKSGLSQRDAAQTAALAHGDYAGVPASARKKLNKLFFTPTFKIAMFKAHKAMAEGLLQNVTRQYKGDNIKTRRAKRAIHAAIGLMLINSSFDLLFTSLGYEREEFGRKYRKTVVTERGLEDSVITWSTPVNLMIKYGYRVKRLLERMTGKDPKVGEPFVNFLKEFSYELHPMFHTGLQVLDNRRFDGRRVYDEISETKSLDAGLYVMGQIAPVIPDMVNAAFGQRASSKTRASKILEESLRRKIGSEYIAKALELASRAMLFTYQTAPPHGRLAYQQTALREAFNQELTQDFLDTGELDTEKVWIYLKKNQQIIDNYLEETD
jgi:hypothetical protein